MPSAQSQSTSSDGSARYETHEHDVIIIGAGGAGLRAAIEASALGLDVGLICKSLLGKAHTVMAEGGVAAALGNVEPKDNWKVHFRDTMKGGRYLNQWRMAQLHAMEAPDRVNELEEWGALFDRTADGRILQRNFGGHKYPRLAHVGDRTGLEMIRTLQQHGIHTGMKVYMECTVTRLLTTPGSGGGSGAPGASGQEEGDAVAGAFGYWRESGRFVLFRAKAVVLATGGIGRAFQINSNSWECTGDGQALAYLAGAELMDMEFMQFHPTGMVWPPSVRGTLITEGVRGEGGTLRNKDQKRIMFDYIHPLYANETAPTEEEADRWLALSTSGKMDKNVRRTPDLLPRDIVARAIHAEVKAGRGSPHGGVFLDIATRRTAADIKRKLPAMYHQFKELGDVDITKEPMEVGPTAHYTMGGIRVDPETQQTRVRGLFAAGECAAGMHGANRLGGNSLSDLLVFGRIAGLHAGRHAKERSGLPSLDLGQIEDAAREALAPFERSSGPNPFALHEELKDAMQTYVGIIRTEEDLSEGLRRLEALRERAGTIRIDGNRHYNAGWHETIDMRNLLIVSEAMARAAVLRKESRGAHARDDFPDTDKEHFAKVNIVSRKHGDTMEVREVPLPPIPGEIKQVLEEE
ncbi:fumarate reductase/succinate dehydrogenase flavoprotein subunit [Pendulispora albinea]|uniref:Fumarate reductase/succinate dehydrogenase flavoprotein subunit n=1 Tax=Pendulispora albinea TaxID=2741071 RepID=A0ABZ2LQC7_9BACT